MNDDIEIQAEDDSNEAHKIETLLFDAINEYEPALENPAAVVLALITTLITITRDLNIDKDSLRNLINGLTKAWDLSHEMVKEEESINVEVTIH